ncbi:PTS system IIB component (Glc family) /PTS system IIC component (Glc family) [Scopulibacillus darangshiensis]|uniref:PTS system IIB component (Glc family) /PTS system IIC component (Glc family) n=1 Tax=Scopulibacillus darangshiensis TaxID=442528 RepID=A0A4R2PCH7_9BACL|nr:PTS transporter subunit EIIC [Scopulibacillus darangshiensis]TCP32118.1 PTS system IIB component (Glc family) /PTS system IIC component (Glc family) [Scopulibacillus darangshiensis]
MDKHRQIAISILDGIGGPNNVKSFTNCMTRLRIDLINREKINETEVKAIEGVLGVVEDETYQIILGPGTVNKVAEQFGKELSLHTGIDDDSKQSLQETGQEIRTELKKKNNTPFKNLLRKIGNIFIPLIPALIGAGLMNGIAGLMSNFIERGADAAWLVTLQPIISIIGSSFFAFLTIFAGINAAKEFGGTQALGGAVSAIIIAPNISDISYTYPLFGHIELSPGQGGIIGAIFAAILISYLERWIRKRIPSSVDIIVTPTIALLVMGLATIFVLMPVANIISQGIGKGATWLLQYGGPFSGFVMASLFLPLVMFGLHQALIPIHAELISQVGYTALLPILAMAGAGQVGAAIAIYIRLKHNKQIRNLIKGALPVGFLGIGEPLIYGVCLPLGRPFITACLGGGFGGAVLGFFAMSRHFVGSVAIGPSGLVLLPLVTGPMGILKTILVYLLGLITSYIAGFFLTYFFGFTKAMLIEHNKVDEKKTA